MNNPLLLSTLNRIADALERIAPIAEKPQDLNAANAYLWHGDSGMLETVTAPEHIPLHLLQGLEDVRDTLLENTRRFANKLPANNALLWGARGMGKSSLIKTVFAEVNNKHRALALVEVHRDELEKLGGLLKLLRPHKRRFILFCDDLSFDGDDVRYKTLKTVLDGSIAGRPDNVLFYATSNRRHLMARHMIENEQQTAIHPSEAVEEKVSLSDRFGLWLGFHPCDQDTYLAMVDGYAEYFKLTGKKAERHAAAIEWAATRGARSGRVAWQFITDLAGAQKKNLR